MRLRRRGLRSILAVTWRDAMMAEDRRLIEYSDTAIVLKEKKYGAGPRISGRTVLWGRAATACSVGDRHNVKSAVSAGRAARLTGEVDGL